MAPECLHRTQLSEVGWQTYQQELNHKECVPGLLHVISSNPPDIHKHNTNIPSIWCYNLLISFTAMHGRVYTSVVC